MIELNEAIAHAVRVKDFLSPYCERMEVAGSVRRGKQQVKDLEMVIVPKIIPSTDLFGENDGYSAIESAPMDKLGKIMKNGKRYKQIDLGGIMLDLFIVLPPAQFGVIFLIRVGPAEFSKFMVTPKNKGGALPIDAEVENGAVRQNGKIILMPEETDFFEFCGIDFIEAEKRVNERLWKKSNLSF